MYMYISGGKQSTKTLKIYKSLKKMLNEKKRRVTGIFLNTIKNNSENMQQMALKTFDFRRNTQITRLSETTLLIHN